MAVIEVDPASVLKYGDAAARQFKGMDRALKGLVDAVVQVKYYGTNAAEFKTKGSELAVEYATAMHKDMKSVSDAVQKATTAISKSLGGRVVSLPVPSAPTVSRVNVSRGDGTEGLDTSALEQLIPTVNKHFVEIERLLEEHQSAIKATRWKGNSKEAAVRAVSNFTRSAQQASRESKKALTEFISSQIRAAKAADQTLS